MTLRTSIGRFASPRVRSPNRIQVRVQSCRVEREYHTLLPRHKERPQNALVLVTISDRIFRLRLWKSLLRRPFLRTSRVKARARFLGLFRQFSLMIYNSPLFLILITIGNSRFLALRSSHVHVFIASSSLSIYLWTSFHALIFTIYLSLSYPPLTPIGTV